MKRVTPKIEIRRYCRIKPPKSWSQEALEGRTHISMTVLTPKKVLQKAGMFDEAFTVTYDTDMWLRIAKDNEIVFIDKPLMTIRKHGNGQLTSKMIPMLEDRVVVAKRTLEDQDIRVSKRWWRKKLLKGYYQLFIRYLKQRNYRKSMEHLLHFIVIQLTPGSGRHPDIIGARACTTCEVARGII